MNFTQKRVIYYTTVLSEILSLDYHDVFSAVAPIFRQDGNDEMKSIVQNSCFLDLNTAKSIDMRLSFVSSFCEDQEEFGMKPAEMEALEVKLDAYTTIDSIRKDKPRTEVLNALIKGQKENGTHACLVVLALILKQRYDNTSISILRKALKNDDLDAGIILAYYSEEGQYPTVCKEIAKVTEFSLHPEVQDLLVAFYNYQPQEGNNLLRNKSNGGTF